MYLTEFSVTSKMAANLLHGNSLLHSENLRQCLNALYRVNLRARDVDSFTTQGISFCRVIFNDILNLVKSLIYHIRKDKRCVYVVYELD